MYYPKVKFKGRRRKGKISPEWIWIAASVQECCTCQTSNKRNCIKHCLQRMLNSKDLAQNTAPPCWCLAQEMEFRATCILISIMRWNLLLSMQIGEVLKIVYVDLVSYQEIHFPLSFLLASFILSWTEELQLECNLHLRTAVSVDTTLLPCWNELIFENAAIIQYATS